MISQPLLASKEIAFLPYNGSGTSYDTDPGTYTFRYRTTGNKFWLDNNIVDSIRVGVDPLHTDGTYHIEAGNGKIVRVKLGSSSPSTDLDIQFRVNQHQDFSTFVDLVDVELALWFDLKDIDVNQQGDYQTLSKIIYGMYISNEVTKQGLGNLLSGNTPVISSVNDHDFSKFIEGFKQLYDYVGIMASPPSLFLSGGMDKVVKEISKEILKSTVQLPSKWMIIENFVIPFVNDVGNASRNYQYSIYGNGRVDKARAFIDHNAVGKRCPSCPLSALGSQGRDGGNSAYDLLVLKNIDFYPEPNQGGFNSPTLSINPSFYSNSVFRNRFPWPTGWSERKAFPKLWNHTAIFLRTRNATDPSFDKDVELRFHLVDQAGNYIVKNYHSEAVTASELTSSNWKKIKRFDFFWFLDQSIIDEDGYLRVEVHTINGLQFYYDEPLGDVHTGANNISNVDLSISHSAPCNILQGKSIIANASIFPQTISSSGYPINDVQLEWYLSPDATLDENSDILLRGTSIGLTGSTLSSIEQVLNTGSWSCGEQYLISKAYRPSVTEPNFSNNVKVSKVVVTGCNASTGINVLAGHLQISGDTLSPNSMLFAELELVNTSNIDLPDSLEVHYFLTASTASNYSSGTLITKDTLFLPIANQNSQLLLTQKQLGLISCGQYKLWAIIDSAGVLGEADIADNVISREISVGGCGTGADLQFSFADPVQTKSTIGHQNEIDFAISNSGTQNISGSFKVSVYESLDESFDPLHDNQVYSTTVSGLSAQASQNYSLQTTVSGSWVCGPYYLLVVIDEDENIAELNEGNNVLALSTISSDCSNFDNLNLMAFDMHLTPDSVLISDTLEAKLAIFNSSHYRSMLNPSEVWFAISSDSDYDLGIDRVWKKIVVNDTIRPRETIRISEQIQSKSYAQCGFDTLVAVIDPEKSNIETSYLDNQAYQNLRTIGCWTSNADLLISNDTSNIVGLNPGQLIHLNSLAKNSGTQHLTDSAVISVYISEDSVLNAQQDVQLSIQRIALFTPGDSTLLSLNFNLPPSDWCGTNYLLLVIDHENWIFEYDELNNIEVVTIDIDHQTSVSAENDSICGEYLMLWATGGTSYKWSKGLYPKNDTNFIDFKDIGQVHVEITNGGCIKLDSITVHSSLKLDTTVLNLPNGDIQITVTASNGTPPYHFSWLHNLPDNMVTITPLTNASRIVGPRTMYTVIAKDTNDCRSFISTSRSTIFNPSKIQWEYWFDNDVSQRQQNPLLSYNDSIFSQVDVSALSNGYHELFIRFKNKNDLWNGPLVYPFLKNRQTNFETNDLTEAIIWLDGTELLRKPNSNTNWMDSLDLDSLTHGFHTIDLAFTDLNNILSGPIRFPFYFDGREFTCENELTRWQFWFDKDTSNLDSRTYPLSGDSLNSLIQTDLLSQGFHTFYVRFLDSVGLWSSPIIYPFLKMELDSFIENSITAVNVWLDGTMIQQKLISNILWLDSLNIDSLESGYHELVIAFEDENNLFSGPLKFSFYHDGRKHKIDNVLTKYRYWVEGDTAIHYVTDSVFNQSRLYNDSLTFTNMQLGDNYFYLQFLDSNNIWSSPIVDTISFTPKPIPDFTLVSSQLCDSLLVQFTNTSDHADSYLWSFGDGTTSTLTSPTHTYTQPGTYDVSLYTYSNMTGLDSLEIWTSFISFSPNGGLDIGSDTILCKNEVLFYSIPTYYNNVLWSNGDTNNTVVIDSAFNQGILSVSAYDTLGCLKLDSVSITFEPLTSSVSSTVICQGDSIYIGGDWQTMAGNYIDIYAASNGCDSISTISLTVLQQSTGSESVIICQGDSILLGNNYKKTTGNYTDTLPASNGCDSIVTTNLIVNANFLDTAFISICEGDSIHIAGLWRKASGYYSEFDTSSDGCDSTTVFELSVKLDTSGTDTLSICQGDSIWLAGSWRSNSGVYSYNLPAFNSCDSIISTTLIVLPIFQTSSLNILCSGDSIFAAGQWRFTSGTYVDRLFTSNGCDSLHLSTINVLPIFNQTKTATICDGDSVYLSGKWQKTVGVYQDSLISGKGCDSLITTNLIVSQIQTASSTVNICKGDSIFLQGSFQSSAGVYSDTLINTIGCDSIVTITLSIQNVDTSPTYNNGVLTANISPATYQWINCNTQQYIPGETNRTFSPTANGIYACEISENGCTDTSYCYVINDIGQEENPLPELTFYPNPTTGVVSINLGRSYGKTIVHVLDASGKLLNKMELQGAREFEVDLRKYADGTYYLDIRTDEGGKTIKVIKE